MLTDQQTWAEVKEDADKTSMPRWIEMNKVADMTSVDIFIDLTDYIQLFRRKSSGDPQALDEYTAMKRRLANEMSPNSQEGALIFWELVIIAFKDYPLDLDIIQKTPAYEIMADRFCEIMKNSVDEFIKIALNTSSDVVHGLMRVDIDLNKQEDLISITCMDNGRGFDLELLRNLEDPDQGARYLKRRGSFKIAQKSGMDCFFGGRSLGLRTITARLNGDFLDNDDRRIHCYKTPRYSKISFFNKPVDEGGGAVVKLVTSLEEMVQDDTDKSTMAQETTMDSLSSGLVSSLRISTSLEDMKVNYEDDSLTDDTPSSCESVKSISSCCR